MDDLSKFALFFKENGVPYETWIDVNKGVNVITVAEAHFHFVDGKFIGVEGDNRGYFSERKP